MRACGRNCAHKRAARRNSALRDELSIDYRHIKNDTVDLCNVTTIRAKSIFFVNCNIRERFAPFVAALFVSR